MWAIHYARIDAGVESYILCGYTFIGDNTTSETESATSGVVSNGTLRHPTSWERIWRSRQRSAHTQGQNYDVYKKNELNERHKLSN